MGRKRRLSIKWCIMLVIVGFVVMQAEAHGQSWKWDFFLGDSECNSFYDPETVFRSPENIVRVWWKEVFKTKQVLISRGFTGSEYKKAAYQINVIEIDCQKKVYCRKFFMICSEKGESILCNIHRRQPDEWVSVREGHAIGALYWKLCQ